MDAFQEATPLWDLSHASSFSQLPDDDFLALLQKQFPPADATYNVFTDGINPQTISQYPLPSLTPPSEDSSPSPPNMADSPEDSNDIAPKRKASNDDLQEGPSQKSQHTLNNDKKGASSGSSRRKSVGSGGTGKDETRLMKRKEQNRAAQRAFRERKEKHVKDLEDKVAALEAKNEQAQHENENLKDLLSRLQNENVMLKQSSFTFTLPKTAGSGTEQTLSRPYNAQSPVFAASPRTTTSASSPNSHGASPKPTNPLDWSSLTSFDPNVLNLLDDSPQPTATDGAMQMDFGFGEKTTGLASNAPYTTIASNPMFMSFASTFDSLSQPSNQPSPSNSTMSSNTNGFNFDMNSLTTWPSPPIPSQDGSTLEDLFSGWGASGSVDFSYMTGSQASISPIAHHAEVNTNGSTQNNNNGGNTIRSPSNSTSSSSSPSSSLSDQLFNSPRESSTSDSESSHPEGAETTECPKTKKEFGEHIVAAGSSPFAPSNPVRKSSDNVLGAMITCAGSSFPKTQKSDQNVEVLSAWRSITQNPNFKGIDMNELCQEFTSKARCDGTKVVLEPQGVNSILESLSKKQ